MKTSRIAAALLIALAPGSFATTAVAQSGADDPMTAMARARFKEGVDFYDKGEYDQARASFLQAYALKKHPAVLLNLAWSCVKSGHALEGKKYFEQFLAEGKDVTDKQRADANDGLAQAKAKLARIEIQATSGTDVTIDGEHVGTAPLSDAVVVEAGAHTLKFKGPDGATDTQSVSVLGGQKAVAKFPQSASAGGAALPPAATSAPSSPAPSSEPAATPPPTDQSAKPADAPKEAPPAHKSTLLLPPNNLVPAIAFGAVAVAGFGTGIAFGAIKGSAQSNADSVATQIQQNGGGAGTCVSPTAKFASACNAYTSDLNDVNQDATIANIGLGVGVAGLLGFVIYWVVADKDTSTAFQSVPMVTPLVGRTTSGLSLSGHF
jgi:tetratricopeptide (TPR) repeat protein